MADESIGGRHVHFVDLAPEHGEDGRPPLLFLHGILAEAITYRRQLEGWAASRRVIGLDQRGHGLTDPAEDYSWPTWVADIERLLDHVGLDRVDLVGHSLGANNAMRFAATHPERVRRVVLVEGGFERVTNPEESDYWARVAFMFPAHGYDSRAAFAAEAARLFPRSDATALADAADLLVEIDGRWQWERVADDSLLEWAFDPGPEGEPAVEPYAAVVAPVLLVRAEHSEICGSTGWTHAADAFPDATTAEHVGSGHNVFFENPMALVDLVDEFLARP